MINMNLGQTQVRLVEKLSFKMFIIHKGQTKWTTATRLERE